MDDNFFSVIVRSRDGTIFEGECVSVTAFNKLGKFDVLAHHANFISLILKELILVTVEGETRSIPVTGGLCRVKGNKVEIFLGVRQPT